MMTTLYRPVGLAELALMFDAQMRAFPPRLPEQPIFYPVLNHDYAVQIARDWNAPSEQSGFSGFVTEFSVDSHYLEQFPVQTVGGSVHQELWVPAERLAGFNNQIQDRIRVMDAFFGFAYTGFIPSQFGLARKNATEQLVCMAATLDYSGMDFICETAANHKAIYLNFPFWLSRDFSSHGVSLSQRDRVLDAIRELWQPRFPQTPLCESHAVRPNA
jgi:hypothetical protein